MMSSNAELLEKAREFERRARREFAWSHRPTEWPHHRQDYARHGHELWKQAEALRVQAGAPLLQYPGAEEYVASVDRSPKGGDRETGRHAKHESAVGDSRDAQGEPA